MQLKLKAKHFKKPVSFTDNKDCPLSRAVKEYFEEQNVRVDTTTIRINERIKYNTLYEAGMFNEDIKAIIDKNPEEVIRLLTIKQVYK